MVVFQSNPTESEGFEQIVDFLNAHSIKYALTVNPTIYTSCIKQFWATAKVKNINGEAQLHAKLKLMGAKTTSWNEFSSTMASAIICLATNQKFNFSKYIFDTMVKHLDSGNKFLMYPRFVQVFLDKQVDGMSKHNTVADEAINEEMDDGLVRAASTASSLEAEQDSGNIAKAQSKATPNKSSSQETDSGGGPKHQDTMGDVVAQTRVLDLEIAKTTQAHEINSLKRRVKKLEKKQRIIDDLDADEDMTLVNNQEMTDVDKDLQGEEVVVEQEVVADKELIVDVAQVSTAVTTVTIDDITLAKSLKALKTLKPNIRRIIIKDHKESIESRTTTIISLKKSQNRGKAKMIEESVKLKKKDQILFDEKVARNLQEEINKEEILVGERAKQKEEANITLIQTWEYIQANVDVDYQLAERLQAKEQQELNEQEKAKLFMKLFEKRRKFFAAKRTKEKRNRPPIKAQQRVNTFVDYTTELVEKSSKKVEAETTQEEISKRVGNELEQEIAKKQKIVDDKETTNLKQLVKIIPEEDIAIDGIPLAVKTLIVD
uniref:Uncharacterized protein n=1 Tax=Tanacetum cinerariifolium TaxID=118510 RepID=A0A699GLN5_TANCI|nr:hypothetical protein [Tanacetum cinerariifolium]